MRTDAIYYDKKIKCTYYYLRNQFNLKLILRKYDNEFLDSLMVKYENLKLFSQNANTKERKIDEIVKLFSY